MESESLIEWGLEIPRDYSKTKEEKKNMLDYKKMFKMRLIQIIVVNIIMIAVTIWLYREGDSFLDVFELWFLDPG